MILRACADIINKLYMGNTNAFNKLSKALTSTLSDKTDVDEELNRLLEKKSQLNGDIDFLLKERAAANTV